VARQRLIGLFTGTTLALVAAFVAVSGVTSAHTPSATLTCNVDNQPVLTISLTLYNGSHYGNSLEVQNTVSASIDGSSVLATTDFPDHYSGTFSAGSPYVSHTAEVIVFAYDDPLGIHHYTKTFELSTKNCLTPTPSPTLPPTPTPTPTLPPTPTPTLPPTPTPTLPSIDPCATVVFEGAPAAFVTASPPDCPFQTFQGETLPPTSAVSDNSGGGGSTPLFALLICFAFGGLGLAAIEAQRRSIRTR
jgi:hypothetical protein